MASKIHVQEAPPASHYRVYAEAVHVTPWHVALAVDERTGDHYFYRPERAPKIPPVVLVRPC